MTMSAQAVQTKEHDEKQGGVGSECDSGAESDAVQVEHNCLCHFVPPVKSGTAVDKFSRFK
jgi:hypothetical protein